jgi:hypothetical protein
MIAKNRMVVAVRKGKKEWGEILNLKIEIESIAR